MKITVEFPFDAAMIMQKKKRIKRELLKGKIDREIRVAILGGSTTTDIKDILDIFLLQVGIKPVFYESEYNKYYEDAMFGNRILDRFNPDIILIFTSMVNFSYMPNIYDDKATVENKIDMEYQRYKNMWEALSHRYAATIIQNNFELPYMQPMGSFEAAQFNGNRHFIECLNEKFAQYAASHSRFFLHDIHYLAANIGLKKWHNRFMYHAYKYAVNYEVIPDVSWNIAKIIKALLGYTKKCLVLDLDNTLWGGIIGDDGVENIELGNETSIAESYLEFQQYVLALKNRGIILAVCSKNDEEIAKTGFEHPDSVLKLNDFISFKANWQPKNINIEAIAKEINIGLDSMVFIDDNPAERQIVRDMLPMVAVPEVDSSDVFSYIRAIEENGYFETVGLSKEDIQRNKSYQENKERQELERTADSYEDFLISLNMKAEIAEFKEVYFDRIAQLTNKTNQFNLTTKRYTRSEIIEMAKDKRYITLYGRLKDKFGDNGLVTVVIGEQNENTLYIHLWLMSCRVLNRGMEYAMMDQLIHLAKKHKIKKIIGEYYRTKKNSQVSDLYEKFGFLLLQQNNDDTVWQIDVVDYKKKNKIIDIYDGSYDK